MRNCRVFRRIESPFAVMPAQSPPPRHAADDPVFAGIRSNISSRQTRICLSERQPAYGEGIGQADAEGPLISTAARSGHDG
jgi:hypothetical protein